MPRIPKTRRVPESWHGVGELSPTSGAYSKTFVFKGDYIDDRHRSLSSAPLGRMGNSMLIDLGIDGMLLRDDALKLYEMGYYSNGDILELGTHRGLSTSILAAALDARGSGSITTVDRDPETRPLASANLTGKPGAERVSFMFSDATPAMDQLIGNHAKFGFIFVDHWHGYAATKEAAERAQQLMHPGAFIQFHDYSDPANADPDHPYGVYQAVRDVIVPNPKFEFYGVFGCCAVFRFEPTMFHRIRRRIRSAFA